MILKMLHGILDRIEKPSRYIGGEYNQTIKDPSSVKLRVGLLFPDVYEVGMSNLGLAIIYDVLNDMQDVWAERIFMPWIDMMNMMRDRNLPLFTIESKTAVKDLDMLGVSLQHELIYTNVLHALDLAKIPLLAEHRADTDPIVIAGGPCTVNPEPIAPVFDAMVVGDGEGIAREIAQVLIETKGMRRHERLKALSKIEGVYVPSFYDGSTPPKPLSRDVPERVKRRIEPILVKKLTKRIVPHMQLVHDRISVEIMRGCTRGCRFCQAGFIYRPVREKPSAEVLDEILNALTCTGYEEVGLLSLSSADHTAISSMVEELKKVSDTKTISVSIPSTRLDAFGVMLANNVGGARRTGLTFAPEAGTQRLRNVINKNVSEEDFVRALQLARNNGWRRVKLYFMVGLPTET
ncbi:MAG: TIGR03960 family B12-binding radical SAM protein, partial [Pseudothermotoga sp.]|nr:TIGR03960 family B12-binding radical SAM protein [Pseudothermotoga sp.]